MSTLPFRLVDAFAARPLEGNPAAVVLLPPSVGDEAVWPAGAWMQAVAAEMNQAETTYITKVGGEYAIRWFTPLAEVDLCGHATLAAFHVLREDGLIAPDATVTFRSRSGPLPVAGVDGRIRLDFPVRPAELEEVAPPGLLEGLRVEPTYLGRSREDRLVEVASEAIVRGLAPDFAALGQVSCRGIIVTAPSQTPEFDFVSRFFAPAVGVPEDHVTGSAHTCLVDHWSRRLGKTRLVARQVSARGGTLHLELMGNRVFIAGTAVTVVRGELLAVPFAT